MATFPQELFGPREVGASVSTTNNEADIAILPNGQTVIVWTARLPGRDVVHMQRFDMASDPIGAPLELGEGSRAQVEVLADGGFAVAWATTLEIVGLRFDAQGNDVTGSLDIITYPERPAIEPDDNAKYIIVPGTGTIERFGTEVFGDIVPDTANLSYIPGNAIFGGFALTALTGGGYVLTGSYYSGPSTGLDMFAMVYSATAGDLVPVDVRLSDDVHPAASDQAAQQGLMATAALDDGGFVLAWRNEDTSNGTVADELRLQRFDKDGVAQGAAQTVGTSPDGILDIAVTALADGGFVVGWTELIDDPTGTDFSNVVIRIYNADGTARTTEFVPHPQAGSQLNPSLVALQSGEFIVSWSQFSPTAGDWEVFARGFTPNGIEIPITPATSQFPLITSSGLTYLDSALAANPDNELRAVWTEQARAGLNDEGIFNNVEFTAFSALVEPSGPPTADADTLNGTANADSIAALGGDDIVDGRAGNDTLSGNRGSDTILGGTGNDSILGGEGDDSIEGGANRDTLRGGGQSDTLKGGNGDDAIWGDNGRDLAILGSGDDVFTDNQQGGANGRDTVWGGSGQDTVYGAGGDDSIAGGDDEDLLYGGADNDIIRGGAQADTIYGGRGNDSVWGDTGRDYANLDDGDDLFTDNGQGGANGKDTIIGGKGQDTILGRGGDDSIIGGDGEDSLEGGADNDVIRGGSSGDTIKGGGGNDSVWGGNGSDFVLLGNGDDRFTDDVNSGANGNDTVNGGRGRDTLIAWGGQDQLTGGADADVFAFRDGFAVDTITDFQDGLDLIDVRSWSSVSQLADMTIQNGSGGTEIFATGDMGNMIVLTGVGATDIGGTDFIFV